MIIVIQPKFIEYYERLDGQKPFVEWLDGLRDKQAVLKIETRLTRVRAGNLGSHRSVGKGVFELKIDYGPGYRIYFGLRLNKFVILCGGTKQTQWQDIKKAQQYWNEYRSEYAN